MKKKFFKTFGVALTLVLLISLFGFATPVAADNVEWSGIGNPSTVPLNLADVEVGPIAVTPDGGTVFAAVQTEVATGPPAYPLLSLAAGNWALVSSTDGGHNWIATDLVNNVGPITGIAVSSNFATDNTLYVAALSPTTARAAVFRSTDGGANFIELKQIFDSTGAPITNIWAIAMYPATPYPYVMVGTNLDVMVLQDAVFEIWRDQELGADARAVAFAPDFFTTNYIWAVTVAGVVSTTNSPGAWGTILTNTPALVVPVNACIGFPDDYSSTTAPNLWVGIDSGANTGGVWRVRGLPFPTPSYFIKQYGLAPVPATAWDIRSIAVSGGMASATILAGQQDNAAIVGSLNGGITWVLPVMKQPTGAGVTYVIMAPDFATSNVAYVGTSDMSGAGTGEPGISAAAFQVTRDGGMSWNQTGLIDTAFAVINDIAVVSLDVIFMVSDSFSLWKTEDATATAPVWERILTTRTVTIPGNSLAVGATLTFVATSPDFATDSVVYTTDNVTGIMKAMDGGGIFAPMGAPVTAITALHVVDATFAFTGAAGNLYRTDDGGYSWLPATTPPVGTIVSIATSPMYDIIGQLLLGNSVGGCALSLDRGVNFIPIPGPGTTMAAYVAFDADYATNFYIYAAGGITAANAVIGRLDVTQPALGWTIIDNTAAGMPVGVAAVVGDAFTIIDTSPPAMAADEVRIGDPAIAGDVGAVAGVTCNTGILLVTPVGNAGALVNGSAAPAGVSLLPAGTATWTLQPADQITFTDDNAGLAADQFTITDAVGGDSGTITVTAGSVLATPLVTATVAGAGAPVVITPASGAIAYTTPAAADSITIGAVVGNTTVTWTNTTLTAAAVTTVDADADMGALGVAVPAGAPWLLPDSANDLVTLTFVNGTSANLTAVFSGAGVYTAVTATTATIAFAVGGETCLLTPTVDNVTGTWVEATVQATILGVTTDGDGDAPAANTGSTTGAGNFGLPDAALAATDYIRVQALVNNSTGAYTAGLATTTATVVDLVDGDAWAITPAGVPLGGAFSLPDAASAIVGDSGVIAVAAGSVTVTPVGGATIAFSPITLATGPAAWTTAAAGDSLTVNGGAASTVGSWSRATGNAVASITTDADGDASVAATGGAYILPDAAVGVGANSVINGLVMSPDGTLYGSNSLLAQGIERSLNPTASRTAFIEGVMAPVFERMNTRIPATATLGTAATPASMELVVDETLDVVGSKNVFFAIDTTGVRGVDQILTYTDTLATPVVLTGPETGTIFPRVTDVTLDWATLTGAQMYHWQIARDMFFQLVADEGFSIYPTVDSDQLRAGQTYYWRVRVDGPAMGAPGLPLLSRWSESRTFTTELGGRVWHPFQPIGGVSPGPGAQDVITKPTFQWNGADWATSYEFMLADNAAFTGATTKTLTTTSWVGEDLGYSTTWYWKVRALSATSESEWSDVGVFTIMAEPEPVVVTPDVTVQAPPAADVTVEYTPPIEEAETPGYIWAIIVIGAVLVIAVIVLIVRTRRPI